MNIKIINRILNGRTIIMYAAVMILLIAVTPEKGAMDILAGFSPQGGRGLDMIGIIRWNLCVLPPVAASILFMDLEMGVLRIYTMIRSENVKKWFTRRFMGIVTANLSYLFLFVAVTEICVAAGDYRKKEFLLFLTLFFLHTLLMSLVSVALFVQSKKLHITIVFYLTVEGIMVVVGELFSKIAAYLPPYWGMIRQVGNASFGNRSYLFLIVSISAVIMISSVIFIIKNLRA
ncbi:MAG: hypothetical protein NC086_11730 [Alistipes sp.]|nr:hypothetical protein [Alistipes sp.]